MHVRNADSIHDFFLFTGAKSHIPSLFPTQIVLKVYGKTPANPIRNLLRPLPFNHSVNRDLFFLRIILELMLPFNHLYQATSHGSKRGLRVESPMAGDELTCWAGTKNPTFKVKYCESDIV